MVGVDEIVVGVFYMGWLGSVLVCVLVMVMNVLFLCVVGGVELVVIFIVGVVCDLICVCWYGCYCGE